MQRIAIYLSIAALAFSVPRFSHQREAATQRELSAANIASTGWYNMQSFVPPYTNPHVAFEEEWLLSCVMPNGAIAMSPAKDTVIPYFSNLAALSLLNRNPEVVRKYIQWYLDHVGKDDPWRMKGTITDYQYEGNREISTRSYDSADAYAGTFLTLVAEYYKATGDSELVIENLQKLYDVADTILALQAKDGLVRAKISDPSKYLMDNCEAYRGLIDFAHMLSLIGDASSALKYYTRGEAIRRGIQNKLWDPTTNTYFWRVHWLGFRQRANMRKWYPDAVSQLFPILTEVISPNSEQAQAIWNLFNQHFPGWPSLNHGQKFAWTQVAYVCYKMGDIQTTQHFLNSLLRLFSVRGKPSTWYSLESSMLIMLNDALWKPSLTPDLDGPRAL